MKKLIDEFKEFETIINESENKNIIDASSYDFLTPTALIPLIYESKKHNKMLKVSNVNQKTVNDILNMETIEEIGFIKPTKDNIYLNLPTERIIREEKQLNYEFAYALNNEYGGLWFQMYLLQELTNNIYDHAYDELDNIKLGLNYAYEYQNEGFLDICIYDQGKSIAGSYKQHGINCLDDCHAIEYALSKHSTAINKELRGNGLRTTIKKLITENHGTALIVSGNGYLYIEDEENYNYGFTKVSNGTFISLRLTKKRVAQYMDTSEFHFPNPYKYRR